MKPENKTGLHITLGQHTPPNLTAEAKSPLHDALVDFNAKELAQPLPQDQHGLLLEKAKALGVPPELLQHDIDDDIDDDDNGDEELTDDQLAAVEEPPTHKRAGSCVGCSCEEPECEDACEEPESEYTFEFAESGLMGDGVVHANPVSDLWVAQSINDKRKLLYPVVSLNRRIDGSTSLTILSQDGLVDVPSKLDSLKEVFGNVCILKGVLDFIFPTEGYVMRSNIDNGLIDVHAR